MYILKLLFGFAEAKKVPEVDSLFDVAEEVMKLTPTVINSFNYKGK